MSITPTTDGYDITSINYASRPAAGIPAFYSTGTPDIKATNQMWDNNAHALRIDQADGQDNTADIFDVEPGCYSATQVVERVRVAIASYKAVLRPGQRWPAVYCSRQGQAGYSLTDVANALAGANLVNIGVVIADWTNDRATAILEVANSIPGPKNPYPIVGRQYANKGPYDLDIFSLSWVNTVATETVPHYSLPDPIPGIWTGTVTITGHGTDGNLWTTQSSDGKTFTNPKLA